MKKIFIAGSTLTLVAVMMSSAGCKQQAADAASRDVTAESATPAVPKNAASDQAAAAAVSTGKLAERIGDLPTAKSTACSIDMVGQANVVTEEIPISKASHHRVRGWLANETAKNGIPNFELVFMGDQANFATDVDNNFDRPDVDEYLKVPSMTVKPGFEVDLDASAVPAGTYSIVLSYKGMADAPYLCDTGRKAVITD